MRKMLLILVIITGLFTSAAAQGNVISYGTFVTGELNANTPSTLYTFNGTAGDFITLEVIAMSSGFNPTVTMLAPSGLPVGSATNALSNYNARDASLGLRLQESGLHSVVIGKTPTSAESGTFLVRLNGLSLTPRQLELGESSFATIDGDLAPVLFTFSGPRLFITTETPDFEFGAEVFTSAGLSVLRVIGVESSVIIPDSEAVYSVLVYAADPTTSGEVTLTVVEPVAEEPEATEEATEEPTATFTPTATYTIIPSSTPTATPTSTPTMTATATEVVTEEATEEPTVSATTATCLALAQGNGLNIRTGPGTDFGIVQIIAPGERVPIDGQYNNWYQITLEDGRIGWVSAAVVQRLGDCSNIPPAVPPAADAPTVAPPPTEEVTDDATEEVSALPVAEDDGSDPYTLRITRGETTSVSGSVSTPEGDRIDRVQWDVNNGEGATVQLTITCAGENFDNTRFSITRGDNQSVRYSCGQTFEYNATTANAASGRVQIEAISSPSYVEWTITGTAF